MDKKLLLQIEKKRNELKELTSTYQISNENISSPEKAVDYLNSIIGWSDKEMLVILCLNASNIVITSEILYKGTINSSTIRIAEIFKTAILYNSISIILAHNHPSGNLEPSPQDIDLTESVVKAGKILEIVVSDHLIISDNGYKSMKKEYPLIF